jgi:protein phosphatase 1 regulatory subunit 10
LFTGSQGSSVDPPTMIEVSTKPPPKAPPSHAGPMSGGGGFNNVQQSSTAFNPPLPGGPPPPGTNQLQSMLQQFGNQGVNQGVNQGGNPGGNPGGQGTGGIDQSALQALLQSVQSGALKVQGGPGNGGGLNGGGMNGGGPPPLPPTSFGAPPPQHAPMGPGMGARAYNQGAMPPGLGGGGMGGGPGPSIGGSVNNGGIIPGQGQGHTHEAWRPLADGGQKGPMPGGNGMCAFFNTPKGCYHGDNCRFRHERGAAPPPPGAYPNRRF